MSVVDDRMFNLVFGSGQDDFDGILPTVEHMIGSIQIHAAGGDVVLEDEGQLGNGESED